MLQLSYTRNQINYKTRSKKQLTIYGIPKLWWWNETGIEKTQYVAKVAEIIPEIEYQQEWGLNYVILQYERVLYDSTPQCNKTYHLVKYIKVETC